MADACAAVWESRGPERGAGLDLVAYGNDARLEYDLRIAPGTRPTDLRLAISGERNLRVDAAGDLVMAFGARELRMKKPVMYQTIGAEDAAGSPKSAKKYVEGGYVLEADGSVGFSVGAYDPGAVLVIDPSLSVGYATFLGGAGDDRATSVVLDAAGKVYIGGTTTSVGPSPRPRGPNWARRMGARFISSPRSIRRKADRTRWSI